LILDDISTAQRISRLFRDFAGATQTAKLTDVREMGVFREIPENVAIFPSTNGFFNIFCISKCHVQ